MTSLSSQKLFILAALAAVPPVILAQQSQQPQSAQTQAQPAQGQPPACSPPVSPQPKLPAPDWKMPDGLLNAFKKQQAKIEKQTGLTIPQPNPADSAKPAQKPAPCPPAAAVKPPATPPVTPPVAAAQLPAAQGIGKPVYVCPPKSTLIPNFPYCIYPDLSVVDAIPLPPGMTTPAPATPARPNAKP